MTSLLASSSGVWIPDITWAFAASVKGRELHAYLGAKIQKSHHIYMHVYTYIYIYMHLSINKYK